MFLAKSYCDFGHANITTTLNLNLYVHPNIEQ